MLSIVSIGDVVKHHLDEISLENQTLKEYVATALKQVLIKFQTTLNMWWVVRDSNLPLPILKLESD